jgi:hypothetical protein
MNLYELGIRDGLEKAAKEISDKDAATMAAGALMLGGGAATGAGLHSAASAPTVLPKATSSTISKAVKTVGKVL